MYTNEITFKQKKMSKSIRFVLISYLMAFCLPLFAQKTQPVVDKETIKKVQQELKAQMPKAKIKTIKNDDGSVYIGEVEKKARQGFGKMFFSSGNVYVGQWESDAISGEGSMIYANGDRYTGNWSGEAINGHGTIQYTNNDEYDGELRDNQRSGFGLMKYATGDAYEGEFADDQRNGNGVYKWKNGSSYSGQWKDDKRSGEGTWIDKSQRKEGTWIDDSLVDGKWTIDSSNELKGQWGDSGFEGHAVLVNGDYSYEGTCTLPGKVNNYKIWDICVFKEGTLKWPNGELSGEWGENKTLKNGKVAFGKDGASIQGEMVEGQFKGVFNPSNKAMNELYDGTFMNDGTFNGTYTVSTLEKSYCFKGVMKKGFPIEGVLTRDGYEFSFKAEYPSDKQANVFYNLGGKEFFVGYSYKDNAHLFLSVEREGAASKIVTEKYVFGEELKDRVFREDIEDFPIGGVKQIVRWTFYEDGIALRTWINDRFYHRASEDSKKHSDSTCPVCDGTRTTTEHGYTVDGRPYSKEVKCFVCNGTGRVKADNVLANIQKDFWAEVAANPIYIDSDGRTSDDIAKDEGFEIYSYTIDGRTIILNQTGERFRLSDHYYAIVSEGSKISFYDQDNKYDQYVRFREEADKYNPNGTFKSKKGEVVDIPFLPCSFYGGTTASFGNILTYKATVKQNIVVKNGIIFSHTFNNGVGTVVTDKDIIDYHTEEPKEATSSFSVRTSSAMAGLGGGSSKPSSGMTLSRHTGCTVINMETNSTKGTLYSVERPHTIKR